MKNFESISKRERCKILFKEFFKIAALVLGGGYVIISAVENEFVQRRKWISSEQMVDLMVVIQSVPGILACNCATAVGYRIAGLSGGICAVLGTLIPPIIVVLSIASFLMFIPIDNPHIQGAFKGLLAAVVGIIMVTALRLSRKVLHSLFDFLILGGVILANQIIQINPIFLLLSAVLIGLVYIGFKHLFWAKKETSE